MPTYVYECPAGHEFERFERKITDKSKTRCPECGKMATRQISGGAGLLFKGSGFYITDYRKSGGKTGEKGEEKGTGGSSAKGESKGESKSESSSKKKSSGDDS